MADSEIRNPAKAYFKWKMPVIVKSEDDWNFWNTEDKYNRTMFIGYNDTTTPHVASLFIIVDGKPMQAVGDDIIARIAQQEMDISEALTDIQTLIDRVNEQQLSIEQLKLECQNILMQCQDYVDDARTWAEGTDTEVADLGGEHSAKGWAQKANEIVSAGLPSDATFDHLTVTGSSKFGQDPDRENQPGLEIESTGEIQAYRTVNMMNGATVSYDETVEMPWSDSSNKVPNTAWVQQAVQHGTIDPNTELTIKSITTAANFNLWFKDNPDESGRTKSYTNLHAERGSNGTTFYIDVFDSNFGSQHAYKYIMRAGNNNVASFTNPGSVTWLAADTLNLRSGTSDVVINAGSGRFVTINPKLRIGGTAFVVDASVNPVTVAFGVTPTVPDITDASDSSDKVPNTKWVQAAIAAGGGGGGSGAVTSVNGKTGEVVLAAADVGAATTADITTALEPYAKTVDVTTTLVDYAKSADVTNEITAATAGLQPKLTAGANITISDDNVISATGGGTGGAVTSVNGKTGEVVLSASDVGAASSSDLASYVTTDAMNTELTNFATTASVDTKLADYQPKLIAGDGIAISESNVISATSTGGGAVSSVNGKTGEVVLNATDVGAITGAEADTKITTALEPYAKSADVTADITSAVAPLATTEALTTGLAGKQDKLTAESDLSVNNLAANSITSTNGLTSETGTVSAKKIQTVADTTYNADGSFTRVCLKDIVTKSGTYGYVTLNGDEIRINGKNSGTALTYLSSTGIYDTTAKPAADASNTRVGTTAWVQSAITAKTANLQPKLTAGEGITISEQNVISATGGGGAVTSVNGNTGAVVLTGDNIMTASDSTTSLNSALAGKQASITADTELTCKSVTTSYDSALNSLSYAGNISFTGDSGNGSVGKITANELFTNSSGYYGTRIRASGITCMSGAGGTTWFNLNSSDKTISVDGTITATSPAADANNNQVATTSWVKTALAGKQDSLTDASDLTVGSLTAGSADSGLYAGRYSIRFTSNGNDKLFVDATGPYVSNLTGGDLGPATGAFNWYINTTTDYNKFNVFNRYHVTDEATHEVTTNDTSVLSIGGSPDNHSTWIDFTANYLSFKGDANFGETGMNHNMNFNGPSSFNNEANFHGSTHVFGNVTFWKSDAEGGLIPFANYNKSTGIFNIDYLTSSDGSNGENRVTIMADSREANYGATFNLPVTVSDASFKRTSTLAADDNSTEIPTTAWVKSAIAASGGSVPDDITCKTLKVTNWDGELDSIEFAGNLKYSGDYGNGSLGIITAREFFANSSGYYSTRVKTSGISLTSGVSADTWFNADSSTKKLTITGDTTVTGTSTVHLLNVGDGAEGQKFNCDCNASFGYDVNLGWTSGRLKCMRDEYNWLFDFNRNASPGSMLKFNDTVTILSAMPAATDSSNKVPTTAWVQSAITAKAATKPTLTYAEKSGEPTVTKIEQCNGGSLCTIMWTGNVNTATGHVYIDLPSDFASAKIVSTQFTAHDTGTAAPWTADASITGGKIMLSVKSTAASSSASATIVLYKA